MVSLNEVHEAFLFVSGDRTGDLGAYLDRATGRIIYTGSSIDEELEELPDDLDDPRKYVSIPGKQELDVGHRLVFRFVAETMPNAIEQVREIFSRKGAYGRFKGFLDRAAKLDAWYRYEEAAVLNALREWCQENEIPFEDSSR